MKRSRPKQHVRKLKSGKKVVVNKGVKKKAKRAGVRKWPKLTPNDYITARWLEDAIRSAHEMRGQGFRTQEYVEEKKQEMRDLFSKYPQDRSQWVDHPSRYKYDVDIDPDY